METTQRLSIADLAEIAGVSVRTVRYYIAEGLLPPPVNAGSRSYYTREHLDRLILIGRWKDAFLPLKEIRRQLVNLDDQAIHDLVESDSVSEGMVHEASLPAPAPMSSPPVVAADRRPPPVEPVADTAYDYLQRIKQPRPVERTGRHGQPGVHEDYAPYSTATEPPSWRRIRIDDGAELLIREDLYVRRRDKIAWLIDWTRKVLG